MTKFDNETLRNAGQLANHIDNAIKTSKDPGSLNHYVLLRNGLLKTFIPDLALAGFFALLGDGLSIFYTYFIGEFIIYIEDEEAHYSKGIWLTVIFFVASALSQIFRA